MDKAQDLMSAQNTIAKELALGKHSCIASDLFLQTQTPSTSSSAPNARAKLHKAVITNSAPFSKTRFWIDETTKKTMTDILKSLEHGISLLRYNFE